MEDPEASRCKGTEQGLCRLDAQFCPFLAACMGRPDLYFSEPPCPSGNGHTGLAGTVLLARGSRSASSLLNDSPVLVWHMRLSRAWACTLLSAPRMSLSVGAWVGVWAQAGAWGGSRGM